MINIRFYLRYVGGLLLLAIVVGIVLGRNTSIAKMNRAKREVKDRYLKGEYNKAFWGSNHLIDSLHVKEEAVKLNLSNAAYLASRMKFNDNIFLDFFKTDSLRTIATDTAKLSGAKLEAMILEKGMGQYMALSDSAKDKQIASAAFNQMGILSVKLSGVKEMGEQEKALNDALEYFIKAMRKDPENEFARYNYELLIKKIQYPDQVFKRVNDLVNQRKYREARDLIRDAVRNDDRIEKKYPDYGKRLQTIINIDSLSRS